MKERRHGRIVAVASTAGLKGYAYVSAYSAAKHAVVGLVRSLALELASNGVTVNAVCPGFTDTDLLAGSIDNIMRKTGRSREQAMAELAKAQSARPSGHAVGSRRRRAVAVRRGRRRHHRPGHRGRRRRGLKMLIPSLRAKLKQSVVLEGRWIARASLRNDDMKTREIP